MKIFLILGWFVAYTFSAIEGSTFEESLFKEGSEAYQSGNFKKALDHFMRIEEFGHDSGEINYNIGNCFFKLGQLGKTILYYERALQFLKRDRDLQYNMTYAGTLLKDKIHLSPVPLLWRPFSWLSNQLNFWELTLLNVGLGWVLILAIVLWGILKFPYRWFSFVVLCLTQIFTLLSWHYSYHKEVRSSNAIILSQKTNIHSGPGTSFPLNFKIHEGLKISVLEETGDWANISLPNDFTGWVRKKAYGKI